MSKLLLCCTKAKPYLLHMPKDNEEFLKGIEFSLTSGEEFELACIDINDYKLNGKIVIECDFDVEEIFGISRGTNQPDKYDFKWKDRILNGACLTNDQMNDYIPHYAIHLKNLNIFDEPRELYEYLGAIKKDDVFYPLQHSPKNMMYVYRRKDGNVGILNYNHYYNHFNWKLLGKTNIEDVDKYVLISVSSQEMCRVANKEQTILVRKNVLKEMLK